MAAPIYVGGVPYFKPGVRFANDIVQSTGSAAPTNGTSGTGAGVSGPGSVYFRTNGSVYVNTNTKASPTWVSLGVGASGAVLTSPTITSPIYTDRKVLAASAAFDNTATLVTLTGFSWTVVAGATYQFQVELPTTMTTVGGLAVAFKLTTATLTSIRYNFYASTAVDNTKAVSGTGTTTADQTKMFDSKTDAYTIVRLTGAFVVNAGGTFAFQAAQNTAAAGADASTVLIGATAGIFRTA